MSTSVKTAIALALVSAASLASAVEPEYKLKAYELQQQLRLRVQICQATSTVLQQQIDLHDCIVQLERANLPASLHVAGELPPQSTQAVAQGDAK